jgi:hypothetical protein
MGKNRETHFEKTFAGLAGAVEGPFGLTVIEDDSGAGEADMMVVVGVQETESLLSYITFCTFHQASSLD